MSYNEPPELDPKDRPGYLFFLGTVVIFTILAFINACFKSALVLVKEIVN